MRERKQRRQRNHNKAASSSTISTIEIQDIIERLKSQRYRSTTRETYYRIWKRFAKFFIWLDYCPVKWEDRIVLFLGHIIGECGLQSTTVKSYLSAIKAILAEEGVRLNNDQFLISSLTKACKVVNDKMITRLPIYKDMLHQILDELAKWSAENGQSYVGTMYAALFTAAYYGMLRVGEVAQGPHAILADNVRIGVNKRKLLFILRSSKTHDQGSNPQLVKLSGNTTKQAAKEDFTYCLYHLIDSYIKKRPHAVSEVEQFSFFPTEPRLLLNKRGTC